ncbi:MAG TPA: hypothetical protein ENI87_00675 [bacterium]|nr:hypothetical protein [bacterium]
MIPRSFVLLLATLLSSLSLTAQDCPRTKAKTIPESVTFNGRQDCGTPTLEIGGVVIRPNKKGCPLFVSHVPEHEIEEPATANTMVDVYAQTTAKNYFYTCEQSWFLIIPWGANCALQRIVHTAVLGRMTTVPCPPIP